MKRLGFTFVLLAALTACQPNYQKQQLANAENYVKTGESSQAYIILRNSFLMFIRGDESIASKAADNLRSYPELQKEMPSIIKQNIPELKTASNVVDIYQSIKGMHKYDLMDAATEKDLLNELNTFAITANKKGSHAFVLSDSQQMPKLEGLHTPAAQRTILNRSLSKLSDKKNVGDSELVKAIFSLAEESKGSATYNTIKNKLPAMNLRVSDINQYVKPLFPSHAKNLIDKTKVTVRINIQPNDRLLYEDLKKKVNAISPAVTVVKGNAQVVVNVKQLKWDEREAQQRNETVTYGRNNVNLLEAALLMPKYSSYQYDVAKGGREVNFAFEVKASGSGVGKFDKLVRDTVSVNWSQCSNARVQNAFGGTTSAGFVANSHMSQTCGDSGDSSPEALRSKALDRVAWKIKTIPPIQRAAAAYSRY